MSEAPLRADRPSHRRQNYFRFAAVFVSLSVSLAIAELVLRAHERRLAEQVLEIPRLSLLRANPHGTGSFRLKPNVQAKAPVEHYTTTVRTNSHGMHWRQVSKERTDRRRRIAFVGDSFTFGCWADRVENSLMGAFEKNVSPERWEILNFGVGGYGMADIELQLQEDVLEFSPRYVVMVLFTGNDFRDTYLGIENNIIVDGTALQNHELLNSKVPPRYRQPDLSMPTASREPAEIRRALRRLALFRFLAPHLDMEHLAVDFTVSQNFQKYTFWSQYPYPEVARQAKDVSIETIERIDAYLLERDVQLAIVAIPTKHQVYAREVSGSTFDISYPQIFVQLVARENGIPYLDLLPVFREHVLRTNERIYLRRDPHLNTEGHGLAGWHISEWFRCCVKNLPLRTSGYRPGNS